MVRLAKLAIVGVVLAGGGYAFGPALSERMDDAIAIVWPGEHPDSAAIAAPSVTPPGSPALVNAPKLVRGPEITRERQPSLVTVRSDAPLLRSSQSAALERSSDRYERARLIQRELARVGCYGGDPDGDWGPGSKRAMQTFLDRVNATLPTDEPDGVLLALLQGQKGAVCTDACRAGEAIGTNGRCIPTALVAQRAPVRSPTVPQQTTAAHVVVAPTAAPAPQPVAKGGWRAEVAVAESYRPQPAPPGLPPLAGPVPAGRMALGVGTPPSANDLAPASPGFAPPAPVPATRTVAPAPAPKPKAKSQPTWARNVFPQIYFDR